MVPFSCVLGGPKGQNGLRFLLSWGPKQALSEESSWNHATLCSNSFLLCTEFSLVACMVTAMPQPCRVINPIGLDGETDPKAEASLRQRVRP